MLTLAVNMTQSLRVMELNVTKITVDETNFAISNCVDALHSFFVYQQNSIIGRVRDN